MDAVRSLKDRVAARYAVALIVVWLSCTGAAFWYFQGQFVRPFSSTELPRLTARWFENQALEGLLESAGRFSTGELVVHFWDPDCPCSRFSRAHIHDLVSLATARGIQSGLVVKPSPGVGTDQRLAAAKALFPDMSWVMSASELPQGLASVSGSPSAAVFDADQVVRYFGPYSSDAFCRVDGKGFVENAIEKMNRQEVDQSSEHAFYTACYCNW